MDTNEICLELKRMFAGAADMPEYGCIEVAPLAQAGSDRLYFRLSGGGRSMVGSYDPDTVEGRCFVSLSRAFADAGRAVPEVYGWSDDCRLYLQEDLGDTSLFSLIGTDCAQEKVLETLRELVRLQKTPLSEWKHLVMHKDFSSRQAMWDLNYFKYEYLKQRSVLFDEDKLEDDFVLLSRRLSEVPDRFQGFMMRDCQSRNVMLKNGSPVFIDYQGGRKGPALYDAVSFLWQARAGFSEEFRMDMLQRYADMFTEGDSAKKSDMLSYLPDFILFRTLQVLGAYGFRGLVERKSHFLMSIPGALRNLDSLIKEGALDAYPCLKKVCCELVIDTDFIPCESSGRLRVEVFSFSYKKGYPVDLSGNGGGFAFDCRSMHNPGRYKEYRQLTGRDAAVKDFLEKRGEVGNFLNSVWGLTDPAVERYISRGFSNLQIGFGCTGGQHRSVYCAEATARHLKSLFPEAEVVLRHREHPAE